MSDIKYSTKGIDLFTLTNVSTEETGHEKEFMLDRKLGTYWKADTTGTQNIDIDLGANYADYNIDHVLFYASVQSGEKAWIYADTNSNYSTQTGISAGIFSSSGWQLIKRVFTATNSYRYWRIRLWNLTAKPSVAVIFIGNICEITVRHNYGDIDGEADYSGIDLVESYGGQRNIPYAKPSRKYWEFYYEHLDPTNMNNLAEIMLLSEGKRYPIWFCDINGKWYFVRIMNNKLDARQVEDELYNTAPILLEEELNV